MRYNPPISATPEEIQQIAIDIILSKAGKRKLVRRRHRMLMREQERKLQPAVKEFMDYMTATLKAGLSRMKGRTAAKRASSIADWDEIRQRGNEILKPALHEVLIAGGNYAIKGTIQKGELRPGDSIRSIMQKQARFDPIGEEAVAWSTKHTAELVVEITKDTMEAIREFITAGINAGKSMPKIARELRPIVGLHSQYAGAVDKFYASLIEEGVAVADASKKAERYAGRLHRRRTMTIARTETAFSLSEGQRLGYAQMGIKNLERVEDPECCDICAEHNGQIYSIKEAEGVLPEHPNCEGTWVAAT